MISDLGCYSREDICNGPVPEPGDDAWEDLYHAWEDLFRKYLRELIGPAPLFSYLEEIILKESPRALSEAEIKHSAYTHYKNNKRRTYLREYVIRKIAVEGYSYFEAYSSIRKFFKEGLLDEAIASY